MGTEMCGFSGVGIGICLTDSTRVWKQVLQAQTRTMISAKNVAKHKTFLVPWAFDPLVPRSFQVNLRVTPCHQIPNAIQNEQDPSIPPSKHQQPKRCSRRTL